MLKMCHRDRLLLILCALHYLLQRGVHYADEVPSPDMTKFSSSGRSSFRTGRASRSSAPPTGRATSYPPHCEKQLVLGASLGVLQILVAAAPAVRGWLAPPTWQRRDLAR